MPKSDVTRRATRYEQKLQPDRIREDLIVKRDEMVRAHAQKANELVEMENKVFGVLGDEPVISMDYIRYYDFAREVYKAKRRLGGGYALGAEVQILLDKWKARHCDARILAKIRDEVFAIPAP